MTPTQPSSFSPLLLLLFRDFTGNNLRSPVSGCSCPSRSMRLQEVCALYRILPRPFDSISVSLFFPIFSSHLSTPLSLPPLSLLHILQFLGAFWKPLSSIKTSRNKRKSFGECCCFASFFSTLCYKGVFECMCAQLERGECGDLKEKK